MARWTVEVTGLRQVLDALTEVDKAAAKRVTNAIAKAAHGVAASASYFTPFENPVSNWGAWSTADRGRDLSYSGSAASAGFKLRRSNFRRRGVSAGAGWDVVQTNAGGSVYELMGGGTRTTTKSGQHLVKVIAERNPGLTPRSLVRAYYEALPEGFAEDIRDQILNEARKAGLV